MPFAHAKWFVHDPGQYGVDWSFLLSPWTVVPLLLGIAAIAAAQAMTVGRGRPSGADLGRAANATKAVPQILAAVVGASLVVLALGHELLVPDIRLTGGPLGLVLLFEEAIVGLWLVSGWQRALAGWALLVLSADLLLAHPLALLEAAYLPGVGAYLVFHERALRGNGPAGAGWRALAVALGSSLVVVAFTEKLAVPAIGLAVLHAHPALDPLTAVGMAPPADVFVRTAGMIEVSLGLLLATGIGGRIVPIAALGPFVATVAIFGVPELVGHAPIYAALIAIAARELPVAAAPRIRGAPSG